MTASSDDCSPNDRFARAALSLDGLSVGDAFGEQFFVDPYQVNDLIEARTLPVAPWPYTDDTEMALSVVAVLQQANEIDQDQLAVSFASRYDMRRGYGPAMHGILPRMMIRGAWPALAQGLFGGQGSFGNGAAMRVAPVGAYFAEDLTTVAAQAYDSAIVTHFHPEAAAGAIAVAVAAAYAWSLHDVRPLPNRQEFLELILPHVPNGMVSEKIRHARDLSPDASVMLAVSALGNGSQISAQDTVPFALWCAGQHLGSYEEALWLTVSGLGDRDTTCAMVGGIVALSAGAASIPALWKASREPLPRWPFQETSEV